MTTLSVKGNSNFTHMRLLLSLMIDETGKSSPSSDEHFWTSNNLKTAANYELVPAERVKTIEKYNTSEYPALHKTN